MNVLRIVALLNHVYEIDRKANQSVQRAIKRLLIFKTLGNRNQSAQ